MTVATVGDAILYLGAVAVALAAIGGLLRWVVVKPLRRWIAEQTKPSRDTAAQVQPNGGAQETTRHLIEQTVDHTSTIMSRLDAMDAVGQENRQLATEALATAREAVVLAREAGNRLDRHITEHP